MNELQTVSLGIVCVPDAKPVMRYYAQVVTDDSNEFIRIGQDKALALCASFNVTMAFMSMETVIAISGESF